MLSREQLGDASNCYEISCIECGLFTPSGSNCFRKTAETALKLLDQVEAQQQEIDQLKKVIKDKSNIIQSYSGIADRLVKAKNTQNNELQILKNVITLLKMQNQRIKDAFDEEYEKCLAINKNLRPNSYHAGAGYGFMQAVSIYRQLSDNSEEYHNTKDLKEIEHLEKFKQDSLGLIQRHEKLKERYATMMEKAQEFIELYEAGPCDFVGEVPSLMDLHHRYYCIFKDIYTAIGGGQG